MSHLLADVRLLPVGGAFFNLRQILSSGWNINPEVVRHRMSGAVNTSLTNIVSEKPIAKIKTQDLAGVVTNWGTAIRGGLLCQPALTSDPGAVVLPNQARAATGIPANGSNGDFVMEIRQGRAIPMQISGNHADEDGITVDVDVHVLRHDDATLAANTPPYSFDATYTLLTQAFNKAFSMGPAAFAGTAAEAFVNGLQSFQFDPGNVPEIIDGDGIPWPEAVHVHQSNPKITLGFLRKENAGQFCNAFADLIDPSTTLKQFGRRRKAGGRHYDDADTEHFLLTLSGGLAIVGEFTNEKTLMGKYQVVIEGHTFTTSVASAIGI